MTRSVSTAEAKAKLSELIGSVAYGGERILIKRRGRPIAALVSIDDATALDETRLRNEPPRGALALIGAWADVDDALMDRLLEDIYAARDADRGREVDLGL